MDDQSNRTHRDQSRKEHNEEFLQRLYARRPQAKAQYQKVEHEAAAKAPPAGVAFEATAARAGAPPMTAIEAVRETIVKKERPVLFVKNDWIDKNEDRKSVV